MNQTAQQYHLLLENLPDAFAYHRMIYDRQGQPADYVFLEVNNAFETMTGLPREQVINRRVSQVLPGFAESGADWISTYARLVQERGTLRFESYAKPFGRYFEVTAYSDKAAHFATVFRDITAARQREQALQASLSRLSHVQRFAGMGIWEYQLPEEKLIWSDECARLFGIEPGTFKGDFNTFLDFVHPDDRAYVQEVNRPIVTLKRGETLNYRHRIVRRDKSVRWVREEAGPVLAEDGQSIRIIGMVIDITAQQEAAEKLQATNQQLRGILESQQDLIVRVDLDGRFLYVNDAYCRKFGQSREQLLGSSFAPLVHPDDLEETLQRMADLYREPYRAAMEQRAMTESGWRWIAWEDSAIRNEQGSVIEIQAVGRDITAQKLAQAQLQQIHAGLEDRIRERTQELESANRSLKQEITERQKAKNDLVHQNRQMKLLLDVSQAMAGALQTTLLTQAIVDGIARLTRLKSAALYLKDGDRLYLEATHPALPPDFPESLRVADLADHPHISRALASRKPVLLADSRQAELTAVEKEVCALRDLRSLLYMPLIYQDKAIGVLISGSVGQAHTFTDDEISICRTLAGQASLAITESLHHERLQAILKHSPSLISEFDLKGRYIQVNEAVADLLGQQAANLTGRSFQELFAPETHELFMARIRTIQETDRPLTVDDQLTVGGMTRFYLTTLFPLFHSGSSLRSIGSIAHDITPIKQTEQELRQTLRQYRRGLESIILSMGTLMGMRDNYTAAHQIRVASLAVAIAAELGLDQDRIDGIRFAAEVHDIGKIGIPADILSKPGRLTNLEYGIIKTHPQSGREILENIEFPWPLADIVHQHHEKMDGSGYPQGLRGSEILLEAWIVCLADVVEAMASHRPYRPAHSLEAALGEIEQKKGSLFDAGVVDACLRLFRETGYQLD